MPDMEKVIKGLEICTKQIVMMRDAIASLKEQEAEIRQLRLALDIAKETCNGIKVKGRRSENEID